MQTPVIGPISDEAWNSFKVASYEPSVSVRPDHVKKLRRARKYGRNKVKRDIQDDIEEELIQLEVDLEDALDESEYDSDDEDNEKVIEERSAVYTKHSGESG